MILKTGIHNSRNVSGRSSGVEHNLAKVGVEGSNPFARSRNFSPLWGYSSVGRASALQAEGHRFESGYLHHFFHPVYKMTAQDITKYKKIAIVGTSGSGKSTLARLISSKLNINHYELDNIFWLPGWKKEEHSKFINKANKLIQQEKWIICGNCSELKIQNQTDLILWLNYPLHIALYRACKRAVKLIVSGGKHCNGNNETFRRNFLSANSIIYHIIKTHKKRKNRYRNLLSENYNIIEFTSPRQLSNFIKAIS